MEFAGTVVSVAVGSRCGTLATVHGDRCRRRLRRAHRSARAPLLAVPANLDLVHSASDPEVFLTAWDALVLQGGLTMAAGRWARRRVGGRYLRPSRSRRSIALASQLRAPRKWPTPARAGRDVVLQRSPHDWLSDARGCGAMPVRRGAGRDWRHEIDRNLKRCHQVARSCRSGDGWRQHAVNVGWCSRSDSRGSAPRCGHDRSRRSGGHSRFAAEMLPLLRDGRLAPVIDTRSRSTRSPTPTRHMEANANTARSS